MDDNHIDVLQYGSPGPVTYSTASRTWTFCRDFSPRYILSYTGLQRLAVPPQSSDSLNLAKDEKEEQALLKNHPELVGITLSFRRLEEISRTTHAAASLFDPKISSLIDFGYATPSNIDRLSRLRTVPIAAFASGRNGNVLSLWTVDDETINTDLKPEPFFRVPTIGGSGAFNAACGESPIRQIRFAESFEESASLLAVRLESCIMVLQPRYHNNPVPIRSLGNPGYKRFTLPGHSHIDPSLLVELSTSQTGGFPHVDVTFNPWFSNQLGVIDERGNWSIWDLPITPKHGSDMAPECLQSGSLPWSNLDRQMDTRKSVLHDGWGKIEWVGDVNTFFACNRREAVLYVMEGATTASCTVEFSWTSPSEWILDMKACSSHVSLVFILTTSRILCLDISHHKQQPRSSLVPQLSWRHNRDSDDLTLRLTSLSVGEEYYLILYSRLDACILAFQVPAAHADGSTMYLLEPFYVYTPGISVDQGLATIRHKAPLKTILFREIGQEALTSQTGFKPYARLIKLFVLDDTLSIREHLFSMPHTQDISSEINLSMSREALPLVNKTARVRRRNQAKPDLLELDGSVVGELALHPHELSEAALFSKSLCIPRTVDFTLVYATLAGKHLSFLRNTSEVICANQGLRHCLERLVALFSNPAEKRSVAGQTMLEIMDCLPVSPDIDDSIQELSWFKLQLAQAGQATESLIYYLPLEVSLRSVDEQAKPVRSLQHFSVLELYDKLIHDWLSVLPEGIPGWTRVSKEKSIRNISTELSLASMAYVRTSPPTHYVAGPSQSTPLQRTDLIPSSSQASQPTQSQADAQKNYGTLSLSTLADQMTDTTLPAAAEDVLSHWAIGGNPQFIDWKKIVSHDITTNKTIKPGRTRRRSLSRGLAEDSNLVRSSPIVPIVHEFGSQPQQDISREKVHSSQIAEDNLPMTQMERGIFGSRQAGRLNSVKSRKKKRAAGF